MDPSQALTGLFTLPFWVLVLIIGICVTGIRWFVQNFAKWISKYFPDRFEPWWKWAWREAALPALPLIIGGLIGFFINQYPYPEPFTESLAARTFIGIIAGLFAAFCYPRIKFYIKKASLNWEVEAKKTEKEAEAALCNLRNKENE